ncbi:MAG TPA: VWA domain-containing protein [Myxococcota bacterium]|nr:VWA domain-containing protein [Myxococcota bacterium]
MTTQHRSTKRTTGRSILTLAVLLASGASACTDASLKCITAFCTQEEVPQVFDNKVALDGNFCSADPNTVGFPYKVLFIVDTSGSTRTSDPGGGRAPAVQAAVNQYINTPEVSFALMSFDTAPRQLVPAFTRDAAILGAAIPQFNQNNGSTTYVDTLAAAHDIIKADADALTQSERARTRYDVQFLSDGVPQPCQQASGVPAAEKAVLDLAAQLGIFSVTLSTIFLSGDPAAQTTCAPVTANGLLTDMARQGGGTFQALAGNQLKFVINFTKILTPFQEHSFYLVNESRVVRKGKLLADSDSDGVPDEEEIATGTDPTRNDPNRTGCGDRTNQILMPNVGLCAGTCKNELELAGRDPNRLIDQDADGLRDCEESALGVNRLEADADGDNFIDSLEVRFGTNFNDASTRVVDTDRDGVTDAEEIVTGTDPLSAEPDRSLAYVYQPLGEAAAVKAGTSCANFNITNVQLVQTLETPNSKAGDNRICVYITQHPVNASPTESPPTVTKMCATANYQIVGDSEFKTPAGGVFHIDPSQFKPVICASQKCK